MHLCKNLWSSDCNRSNELCVIDSTGTHTLDENEVTKCARNENCKIIVLNFLKTLYKSAKSDSSFSFHFQKVELDTTILTLK